LKQNLGAIPLPDRGLDPERDTQAKDNTFRLAYQIARLSPKLRLVVAQEIELCPTVSLAACLLLRFTFAERNISG